jgi:hypothetical protein
MLSDRMRYIWLYESNEWSILFEICFKIKSRLLYKTKHINYKKRRQYLNLLLCLFIIESCPIFHPVCLFFYDVDIQFLHQRFGDHSGDLGVFGFLFFVIFISRLSSILFTGSLHVHLLIPVHLITSWISQMLRMQSSRILFCKVSPVMHFKVLISIVFNRHLMMVVSALVSKLYMSSSI